MSYQIPQEVQYVMELLKTLLQVQSQQPLVVPLQELQVIYFTEEELKADARCRGASDKRAQEMAKQAIVEVNGEPVRVGDGSVDRAWNNMHPKVRTLVSTAWVRLHLANDDEVESFFASRTSSV